jgi:HPt (histidine-containing phosphotransfer) domain-containing protein
MSESAIDPATFAELEESAGADFVRELVQTFLEEAPVMLKALREAQAAGDADAFRRNAHSLKSNGLTFGALALGAQARALELGGLQAAEPPSDALGALDLEWARVAAALQERARHD